MTSHIGQQRSTVHTLSNIARSKHNQTVNIGQLIEYNMRNNFLENHAQNVVEMLVCEKLYRKSRAYLLVNSVKCLKFLFILSPSQGLPKYIKTKMLATCFNLISTFFTGANLHVNFLHDFQRKFFLVF